MENRKIVVANLKMNMIVSDVSNYLKEVNDKIVSDRVIICPTSIYVPYFLQNKYKVGLQNTFLRSEGAYTGEISPKQASSMGITFTIIGHSERRMYFDENEITINKKILEALKYHLKVILCVGETLEEKNLLKTKQVLRRQIVRALTHISEEELENIIIAYEPVWAIGTSKTPTNDEIEKNIEYIKNVVNEKYSNTDIKVLYGGSINDKNINELNKIKNVSGFLVGGASLDPNKLFKIIEEVIE